MPNTTSRWPVLLLMLLSQASLAQTPSVLAPSLCDGSKSFNAIRHNQQELRNLLWQRRYPELDTRLSNLLADYQAGLSSDENLMYAIRAFQVEDIGATPFLQEWLKLFPRSYAANLAIGAHYHDLAFAARGHKFRDDTTAEQVAAFRSLMKQAQHHITSSLKYSKKPTVSFDYAMRAAATLENRDAVKTLYKRALAVDPASFSVRSAYIWAMDVRWQGLPTDLVEFQQETQQSVLDEGSKRYVSYLIEMRMGDTQWGRKASAAADEHFQAAVKLCPIAEPWSDMANMHNEFEEWKLAIDALDHYLALEPDQAWAIRRKAWALRNLGEWPAALELYRKAADMGDDNAQAAMGWILMKGEHATQDLDAAIRWLRLAVQQNNQFARDNLETALQMRGH